MILAGAYLLVILFFIYKNGLFGIFEDKTISKGQFTLFFIFKCLAIPVFYYIYQMQYGGIENFDAGNFLRDSRIIHDIFFEYPMDYLKLLFGLESDAKGTEIFSKYISRTNNWDEGISWRLIFNDNRSLIRIHSVIHFISFGSYYVHALISCLLGYIGIGLIYRSLKHFFISKEIWLLGVFIFLPNLWLFSGALLKEPIVILNIGLIFFFTDRLFNAKYSLPQKLFYVFGLLFIICYLKPQIGLTVFTLYILYKFVETFKLRFPTVWYLVSVMIILVLVNFSFILFRNMSMFGFINKKQSEFYDVARGGIFLKDSSKFVRLSYKPECLIKENESYRIRKDVPFYYWEDTHQRDTLYCAANKDTITTYKLMYQIVPANSGYLISELRTNTGDLCTILHGLFRGLGFPFSFKGFMNAIVSLEGLFLTLCLLLSCIGIVFVKEKNIILFFLFSSVLLFILFGIATPNLGAIVRYRCVISPFIVLAVLYIINHYETGRVRTKDNT